MPDPTDTPLPDLRPAITIDIDPPTEPQPGALLAWTPDPDVPRATRRKKEPTLAQRARGIASVYVRMRPLTNTIAAAKIVEKAILTGDWTDDDIRAALRTLAEEKRPVTITTLRIALQKGAVPERKIQPKAAPVEVVYIMRAPGHRPVKIGTAGEVDKRAASLGTASPVPLEVLWTTPGDHTLEKALHEEFKEFRLHGEWFDFGDRDPVQMVANAVNAIKGMRPVVLNPSFDHSRFAKLPEYRDAVVALNMLAHADLGDMDRAEFLDMVREIGAAVRYLERCKGCLADVIPVAAHVEKSKRLRCEYECPRCGAMWMRKNRADEALRKRGTRKPASRRADRRAESRKDAA